MKKSDLKDGMVVELRNGNRYMFISEINNFISETLGYDQYSFNDDLTHCIDEECDIMKVFKPIKNGCFSDILKISNELIWERKEVENENLTLTQDQHDKLRALRTLGYNWIARDKDSYLYAYNKKPIKMITCWERNDNDDSYVLSLSVLGFNIPFIKWEENKPRSIEDLLKLEVK